MPTKVRIYGFRLVRLAAVRRHGVRMLKTAAFRNGVIGDSRPWLIMWVTLTGTGFMRRRLGRSEDVVYRTELHAGERLIVEHHPPTPSGRRRRQKAAQNQP